MRTLTVKFPDWMGMLTFLSRANGWIFRGQQEHDIPLQTSLERAASILKIRPLDLERRSLREFKRRAALSGETLLPEDDNIVEWLALMQHYGAPTRLLDFTHSAYVALFFAVHRASKDSEIWCIRSSALAQNLAQPWSGDKNHALRLLLEPKSGEPALVPPCVIFKEEPFYVNRRLALQQGCFVIPFDTDRSFFEHFATRDSGLNKNLPKLNGIEDYLSKTDHFCIQIPKDQHPQIRSQLRRMNMTTEHLFPGLDGLAGSFWQEY